MTAEEKAKILALREQGLSQCAIAALVGRAQSTVSRVCDPEVGKRARITSKAWKDKNRGRNRARDAQYSLRLRLGEPKRSERESPPYKRFLRELGG